MDYLVEVDDPEFCSSPKVDVCDGKDNIVDDTPKVCENPLKTSIHNLNNSIVQSLMSAIDVKFEECKSAIIDVVDNPLGSVESKLDKMARSVKLLERKYNSRVEEGEENDTTDNPMRVNNYVGVEDGAEEQKINENDEQNVEEFSSDFDCLGKMNAEELWEVVKGELVSVIDNYRPSEDDSSDGKSINEYVYKRCSVKTESGPSKLRKLETLDVYNLYRKVYETRLQLLNYWLFIAGPRDVVEMPTGEELSRKFFDDLLNNQCLSSHHMDVGLYHIRKMVGEHVDLFDQGLCIMDYLFMQNVISIHVEAQKVCCGKKGQTTSAVKLWMMKTRIVCHRLRGFING